MIHNKEIKLLIIFDLFIFLATILTILLNELDILYLIITIFSLLITNLIFIIFIRKEYKRIKELSNYMNNILNNDYRVDIRDYEEGSISRLKNDIYKMTVKLKEQTELTLKDKNYLEEVLSDISHQLKTPLTSMYVINDILLNDDKMNATTKKDFLIKNRNQLERIEWLVTSLLKMSRLDKGSEKLVLKRVKIDTLIDKVLSPLKIPIELKKQNLVLDYDKNVELNIDLNWTVEALINILKNAHEHTKEEGIITIKVNKTPIYNEIKIIDNGEGIAKEELPHIFERFYKGKRSKESIGIGLHMAKKIINLENGDIKVSSKSKGTTFSIKFYKGNL